MLVVKMSICKFQFHIKFVIDFMDVVPCIGLKIKINNPYYLNIHESWIYDSMDAWRVKLVFNTFHMASFF